MNPTKLVPSVVIIAATSALAQAGHTFQWHTVDGGGAMRSTSASLQLSGTIGQPDAGPMEGLTMTLTGGFWFDIVPGDCTEDGAINLFDLVSRSSCVTGPSTAARSQCQCLDIDGDGDVDLLDAAEFQIGFSGA